MIWQKFIKVGGKPLTWISAAFRAMSLALGSRNQPTGPNVDGRAKPFANNHLNWPVKRSGRSFRVFVVEPGNYEPANHAAIFNSAVRFLVAGETEEVDLYQHAPRLPDPQQFDLVTFPEAFLPLDALLVALADIPDIISDFGCVHVGLRPSSGGGSHLIPASRLRELIAELKRISTVSRVGSTASIKRRVSTSVAYSRWMLTVSVACASIQRWSPPTRRLAHCQKMIWRRAAF
jgi:hypothetical protein